MIKIVQTKINYLLLSIFIIFIDQITKYLMFYNYKFLLNMDFIIFRLDFVKNYGAAFSIFNGSRLFLSSISIIFSLIFLYLILRKSFSNEIELYSYSFILGGTLGNGIDRVLNGFVIDFINLNFIKFPVFNIADISINIGLALILYRILKINR